MQLAETSKNTSAHCAAQAQVETARSCQYDHLGGFLTLIERQAEVEASHF